MRHSSFPPVAAYRLQLHKDFSFTDLIHVVDYLSDMGISHLYLSPVMESTKGSLHGYDCIDFSKVSTERGGKEGLISLACKLREKGMHIILDIIPNHMAAVSANPYWHDVLKKGKSSEYSSFFDMRIKAGEKIRLPVLTQTLEAHLENKDIRLDERDNEAVIEFKGDVFPLNDISQKRIEDLSLKEILNLQYYKFTQRATSVKNPGYRRFFDVSNLVGICPEKENVYYKTHEQIFELIRSCPEIAGVRIDHIDGLSDPAAYLKKLAKNIQHIWVEKILSDAETIPPEWPVEGTTGYEFINAINHEFIHLAGWLKIRNAWQDLYQLWPDFLSCVHECKKHVLENIFSCEFNRLCQLSAEAGDDDEQLSVFWSSLTIFLPAYRTYFSGFFSDPDRKKIDVACLRAEKAYGEVFTEAKNFFLPRLFCPEKESQRKVVREWQQLTGPVMAKGLEDTAHYRYTPLAALNEVGCMADLESSFDFFDWIIRRSQKWPHSLNTTSTHDTKRSEDVRNRLYALADRPEEWLEFIREISSGDGKISSNIFYFYIQTILGSWPLNNKIDHIYIDRIQKYMLKAVREAKLETSWLQPRPEYENKVKKMVSDTLPDRVFQARIGNFAERIAYRGAINSLSILTLKMLLPGVPDIYQGNENWDFSLVDPDNRRHIDYNRHITRLRQINDHESRYGVNALLKELTDSWKDGGIKIWLTRKLLEIRCEYITKQQGAVRISPLEITGMYRHCLCGYTLSSDNAGIILMVLVPRYPGILKAEATKHLSISDGHWGDTSIKFPDELRNVTLENIITGKQAGGPCYSNPEKIFKEFPVCVLAPL